METDLSIRLHLYVTAADRLLDRGTSGCADAVSCWRSATAAHSAGIICSHTRVIRGDSPNDSGEDELELLLADKKAEDDTEKPRRVVPLVPGQNSAAILAQGAEGIVILKARNA